MVYTKKKHKFAVQVDEFGRNKRKLNKLLDLLEDKYPYLKQAPRYVTTKRVAAAKKGDFIIFGFAKKYDFRVLTEIQAEEYFVGRRTPKLKLSKHWREVKELLYDYATANHPDEFEDNYKYCKNTLFFVDDFCSSDLYYTQQKPRKSTAKKRRTTKRRNNLHLEEVNVYHNFVKVGWDVYDIWLNENEEEYVKVDGNIYWIDRDSNGNGKISVE